MLRRVVSIVFVTGALVALMNAAPIQSVAQLASPSAGTPGPGSPPTQELCRTTDVIHTGTEIVVEPPGEAGVVKPADATDHVLWLVEITIPPQTCREFQFHAHDGPVVLFVQSGSIEYAVHSATTPPATVMMGHQDATPQLIPPDQFEQLGEFEQLSSGDWVTQDRAAWFTYRNPGPGSAVISMAAFVVPPDDEPDSSGKKG